MPTGRPSELMGQIRIYTPPLPGSNDPSHLKATDRATGESPKMPFLTTKGEV